MTPKDPGSDRADNHAAPSASFPDELLTLSRLPLGETGTICGVTLEGTLRSFVARFGFVDGAIVSAIRRVPLGGLRVYRIGQAEIALRPEMAEQVLVLRKTA